MSALFPPTQSMFCTRLLTIFNLLFFSLVLYAQSPQSPSLASSLKGDIHIQVPVVPDGTEGFIVTIYRNKESFLKNADELYYFELDQLSNKTIILPDIEFGDLTLSLAADMDGNQKLNTKIFGIPSEPVGFVNNPKPKFGPPAFEDCVFSHNENPLSVSITLKKL